MIANYKLEPLFLDPHIRQTHLADDSFYISGLERAAKFVAMRGFRILEPTDTEERMLEVRKDLVKVIFCPSDLTAHHIDITITQIPEIFQLGSDRYCQLEEGKVLLARDLMHLLVLGGGVAGILDHEVRAAWGSSSFRAHLEYDRPQKKELADSILKKIRTLLYPTFNLSQL